MLVIGVAQTPYVLGDAGAHVLTSRDLAGGLLQLLSVIVSNAARILMKTSAGVFSGPELIQQSNAAVLMVAMSVVLILNGARAEPWEAGWVALSSGASSVAAFVVLSVGVFTLAATFQVRAEPITDPRQTPRALTLSFRQVEAIRRTGPAVYGSYSSLRVLVGLAGSWLWLDEPVENWLEWVGIGIVFATLSWWVWSRGKEAGT
jgi:drug/metabolite transporter (DMT)-like permease